ncbi:MAG: nucleotide sugar dehydrogenase, partial [Gammaproteobacteria bacterium]|nr:nucleotide sugar dehydrogenase [Gammaproteobacteria bacterium]
LDAMAQAYDSIVKAGTYKLSSIRAAEATKVVENIQRDLNISFMNEVALILHQLDMDSIEVFNAMQTKWNCLPFRPGLVGGHCIPVNSYYLAHKAEEKGFHPEVILAGRHLNEKMPKYIVENTIKKLIHIGNPVKGAKIAILGLSYKENTPDVHDTPTTDIMNELKSYDVNILVHDPVADVESAKKVHGIQLSSWEELTDLDAIIFIVAHREFVNMDKGQFKKCLKKNGLIMDIKGLCDPSEFTDSEITLWRL